MAFAGMTRTVIADDTIAVIVAASTAAGARVYKSRTRKANTSELPMCTVEVHSASDEWQDWSGGVACSVYAMRTSQIVIDCLAEQTVAESDNGNDADNDLSDALSAFANAVVESLWGSLAWRSGTGRTTVAAALRPFHDIGPVGYEIQHSQDGDRRIAGARVTIPVQHQIQFGA